jgi:Xaa-Pro dipeptidase
MADQHRQRRERLLDSLPEDVDAVFLPPSETLRYFTGLNMHKSERPIGRGHSKTRSLQRLNMHKSERPMLLALHCDAEPAAVLPKLETGRIRAAVGESTEFFVYEDATDPVAAAKGAFQAYAAEFGTDGPIAAEYRSTRLLEAEVLSVMTPPDRIVDAESYTAGLRARKDETEIDALREAAAIIDRVLADVTEGIEPGMTERAVAREIHEHVLDSDADDLGVLIVASGPNTAKPHTNTSDREIQDGDPVIIDAGVVYRGYYSDITRTYMVGSDSERIRELHEHTRGGAKVARETVEPGRELQTIDQAARAVIEEAGYGDYFPHRVGHGLGLEGHEPPYLVEGNDAPLEVGHAVTVEPGIYVEGVGGVRVEDDVVVTEDGAEVLTSSPQELRVL